MLEFPRPKMDEIPFEFLTVLGNRNSSASSDSSCLNCSKSLENLQSRDDNFYTSSPRQSRRQYSSHEELTLCVRELLVEGQRISDISAVLGEHLAPTDRSESLENFADFTSPAVDSSRMARSQPVTLATVLENMPLVYNSSTKNLELPKAEINEQSECDSSSPELEIRGKIISPGSPRKPLLSNDRTGSVPTISDQLESSRTDSDPCVPVISCESSPPAGLAPRPFKKGHVRHSSYETASITLQPFPLVAKEQAQLAAAAPPPPCSMNRTQSLHRTTDSLSSSLSIGSLSFYSDCSASAASIEVPGSGGSQIGGHDSALGDSESSKRSSLDRRSQCSALSGEWLDPESSQLAEGDGDQGEIGANISTKRKGLALPSILPRLAHFCAF